MENYDIMGQVGEGTYGVVLKARHKESGQLVAIKTFKESDEDEQVRKTALREVRILKQLKHDNIVNLIEVFRRKGKLYLVFEYVERTILEDLERNPEGLSPDEAKQILWQLIRSIEFCHSHNIIHRDIKPENLLVSKHGVLKLCDFGFARTLAGPGAKYTDYVATRWYRSPELLVGDQEYGKPVDVWAIGCMFAEMANGLPLFPGESDIDQLFHIIKCMGKLTARQEEIFKKNPLFVGIRVPDVQEPERLEGKFNNMTSDALGLMKQCLTCEPMARGTCSELLRHPYFHGMSGWFQEELKAKMDKDAQEFTMKRKKLKRSSHRSEDKEDRPSRHDHRSERREERRERMTLREIDENHQNHQNYQNHQNHHHEEIIEKRTFRDHSRPESRGSIHSDYAEDYSNHSHHLPDLRIPTPKAQRLVAFPHLASDTGEVENDVANSGRRRKSNMESFPSIGYPNNKKPRSRDHAFEMTGVAPSYKPMSKSKKYGKAYHGAAPRTPNYDNYGHTHNYQPPRSPYYEMQMGGGLPPPTSPSVEYQSRQSSPRTSGMRKSTMKGGYKYYTKQRRVGDSLLS